MFLLHKVGIPGWFEAGDVVDALCSFVFRWMLSGFCFPDAAGFGVLTRGLFLTLFADAVVALCSSSCEFSDWMSLWFWVVWLGKVEVEDGMVG